MVRGGWPNALDGDEGRLDMVDKNSYRMHLSLSITGEIHDIVVIRTWKEDMHILFSGMDPKANFT